MLATPQRCHICFIIPNTPLTPGTQNPWQVETYKIHLGSAISEQQVYRADHAGISYLFIIYVLNNKMILLLTPAFCSFFRHAWGSWKRLDNGC